MTTSASTPSTAADATPVAVGVLQDAQGRWLVTRRPDHKHLGGKWEFPGGKIHAGEGMPAALARELHEELGVTLQVAQPLLRVRHAYSDKTVMLDVWRVSEYAGVPHGREGQALRWVTLTELGALDLPEADRPILRALSLPPLYLISDAQRLGRQVFLDRFERALRAGARLIQLREPGMPAEAYRALAKTAAAMAHRYDAKLLLNADPAWVAECGADGVHLPSRRLMALDRRPLPPELLVAASCHDTIELAQAGRIGADFTVLSPVKPTATHPQAAPLGWERFASLRKISDVPVYALGGLAPQDLAAARAASATGIAMIRGIWDAPSIEEAVRAMAD